MADVHGSDHCPVKSLLQLEMMSSTKTPALCTKNFKEFAGRQLKMSTFFCKRNLEDPDKLFESESKKIRVTVKTKQQSSLLKFFGQPRTTLDCLSSVEATTITKQELAG
jgi:AP endonuclease-2